MAVFGLSWSTIIAVCPILLFLGFYIRFKFFSSKYWSKRNIPHLEPNFMLGNLWRAGITENMVNILADIYAENKKKKVIGMWMYTFPQLMVMDLDLTKKILIRDFNIFRDRGVEIDTENEPLAGHLFFLSGKKWRNLRVKLTPTFTSGKMKFMFPTITRCGEELQKHLRKIADSKEPVEVKDLMARFTTDVISSCAFGLETNSLENPNSEFRKYGEKIFEQSAKSIILSVLVVLYPKISKMIKLKLIPKDVNDFFFSLVREAVEYREKNNVARNDFLQLLIQLMRAGKVEDADRNPVDVDGLDDNAIVQKFSLSEAAAQSFIFFGAGFETSSSALTYALYELALNPDIQEKLQAEIDENTKTNVSYEAVMEMEYLDKVVQETLRKHPPVGSLFRTCNAEYYMPEIDATIDKGTMVTFSVKGLHRDPELYPNPEKFDPERFFDEAKSQRDSIAFLPFGDGPRNCIGNRFGLMQIKVGLVLILKEFNVEMAKTTPIRIKYDVKTFVPLPVGGMPLAFSRRKGI